MPNKYSWFPENGNCLEVYDTIWDAVKDAQHRYDEQYEEFEDREAISPIISVGPVRRFNMESAIGTIVDSIEDSVWEQVHDMAFGCDIDPECRILVEDEQTFKKEAIAALLPLAEKYLHINPEWICTPTKKYNLERKEWVEP